MKNVLIIVAGDNGTIGRCSLNLLQAFKCREDVDVKCVGIHRLRDGFDGFKDCEFFSDTNKKDNIRKQVKWLKRVKESFNPDITISTLFSTNMLNVLCGGNDFKVGIFHSPHYQGKSYGFIRYILFLFQYWFVFPKLDLCSCVSKEVEEDLLHFNSFKKTQIKIIYNIHNTKTIIEKAKEEAAVIPLSPYFIYCGRLDANKAPMRAIKAISLLKTSEKLVFIGKGDEPFVEDVKRQVDNMGLSNSVLFLGEKSNPYPYIKGAKALVSCSYSEGLPGVIIESLALGIPVVSTNSSRGVWEILAVEDSYNQSMKEVFETKYGIITSNNAAKDKTKEDADIENLVKGYQMIDNYKQIPKLEFLAKVDGRTITDQYLSLIQ